MHLFNNSIRSIEAFRTIKFKKITKLLLYSNKIEDIEPLSLCDLRTLKVLNIYENKIMNIDPLAKCNFTVLKEQAIQKLNATTDEDFTVEFNGENYTKLK